MVVIKINFQFQNKNKISKKNLSVLCRQISFMLQSGISISKALEILTVQSQNKNLKIILSDIHKNILEGKSFSQCLLQHGKKFPALMINMIKAGENAGRLDEIMNQLANYYQQENDFITDFKRAMIYPCIVCVMMLTVLIMALTFVIPSYAQMFSQNGAKLPLLTQIVIGISNFVGKYYLLLILFFITIFILLVLFLKTDKGQIFYGKFLFSSFVKKIYRIRLNFIFAQIFGMLLRSGVDIISVFENVKDVVGNKFLDKDFDLMINQIRNGESVSEVINKSGKFNTILSEMINVGENSGNLPDTMLYCQKYFENEFKDSLKKLEKIIEPAFTIITGIILGIIMLAIMEPTFTLNDIF